MTVTNAPLRRLDTPPQRWGLPTLDALRALPVGTQVENYERPGTVYEIIGSNRIGRPTIRRVSGHDWADGTWEPAASYTRLLSYPIELQLPEGL